MDNAGVGTTGGDDNAGLRPATPAEPAPAGARQLFEPDLLDRCISCGFCLPACPTYRLTGEETSSPRGRITLMRALQDGSLAGDDPTLREQSSFCLGCRACEPVCPAGVQYGQLLERWRVHQWRGRRRPLLVRLLTRAAAQRRAIQLAGRLRRAARGPAAGREATAPATAGPVPLGQASRSGPHLMLGCFERVLFPRVSVAARSLAPELAAPTSQGCCGALHAHNGELDEGERLARRLGEALPGRIVTTSGGCAAHLAGVLGRERVAELSEYLGDRNATLGEVIVAGRRTLTGAGSASVAGRRTLTGAGSASVAGRRARVALQDSCHLRNGLGVWREPRQLLRAVADYVELPDAGGCCGAAGTYALLRPRDSRRVLAPKLDQIEAAGIDYLVVVNPGCQRQLITALRRRRSRVRVLHLAELLSLAREGRDGATG
jgi:glycolate oxidase iron-sulfur subunit